MPGLSPQTDVDRAWKAVHALKGATPRTDHPYEEGYWDGYSAALDAACTAIEDIGGRDFETVGVLSILKLIEPFIEAAQSVELCTQDWPEDEPINPYKMRMLRDITLGQWRVLAALKVVSDVC